MTIIRSTIVGSALSAAALSVLLLTGCASSGDTAASDTPKPSAEQSVDDACAIANKEVSGITSALQDAQAKAATDPASVAPAVRDIEATLTAANDEITNSHVHAALERAAAALESIAVSTEAAIADPASVNMADLQALSTEVTDSFNGVGELCS